MKKKTYFDISAAKNKRLFIQYMDRLTELSLSMFEWVNLPDSIDSRFLELTLFTDGQAVFFNDDVMGFLALQFATAGGFDVYRVPTGRRAYAVNGYTKSLNRTDSVIIWNNLLRKNTFPTVEMYAFRLYMLDSIIDINANAQKTPILVQASDTQRLTLTNLYKEFDGNAPVIFGDKNLDINGLKVLNTNAPFVADKIYQLKAKIWNEALTYLGITNINTEKKERLITDEVNKDQGGVIASRYSRLVARQNACKEINRMFDLNIDVKYRADYDEDLLNLVNEFEPESEGGVDE